MNVPFLSLVLKLIVTMELHPVGTALCIAFACVVSMTRISLAALRAGESKPKI